MNGEIFLAYVREVLAPTLQPGDIVIMDNLSSHKVSGVRAAIEGTGAMLLYLLSPAILTGLQPHRTGLLKTQGTSAKGC